MVVHFTNHIKEEGRCGAVVMVWLCVFNLCGFAVEKGRKEKRKLFTAALSRQHDRCFFFSIDFFWTFFDKSGPAALTHPKMGLD